MPYKIEQQRIAFETPVWRGVIALDSTGNMIRLTHRETGMELFHSPASSAALAEHPAIYGIPLLLPPNRIRDGRFTAGGREYRFPVNEETTNCFLHGLALGRRFELDSVEETESVLRFRVSYSYDSARPEFSGFPCEFLVSIVYELSSDGMSHTVSVENRGTVPMPLGVGFHTAFYTPGEERVTVEVPHRPDGAWTVHPERRLPDGTKRAWTALEEAVLSGNRCVEDAAFSGMFQLPEAERRIRIRRKSGTVCYEIDPRYLHLACWNGGGGNGFFCIEPMSWMTDAPNMPLPPEVSGFFLLPPQETRRYSAKIRVTG